jgi:four helix bundle protein
MLALSHKKLTVYQRSVELVSYVYLKTEQFPKEEKFGLVSQMRRSAVSISSNIAEGASRKSEKERKRFYEIARSSLVELDTQVEISLNLKYFTKKDVKIMATMANATFAMLSNMV